MIRVICEAMRRGGHWKFVWVSVNVLGYVVSWFLIVDLSDQHTLGKNLMLILFGLFLIWLG